MDLMMVAVAVFVFVCAAFFAATPSRLGDLGESPILPPSSSLHHIPTTIMARDKEHFFAVCVEDCDGVKRYFHTA